jgi:CIC family chloride channel protein
MAPGPLARWLPGRWHGAAVVGAVSACVAALFGTPLAAAILPLELVRDKPSLASIGACLAGAAAGWLLRTAFYAGETLLPALPESQSLREGTAALLIGLACGIAACGFTLSCRTVAKGWAATGARPLVAASIAVAVNVLAVASGICPLGPLDVQMRSVIASPPMGAPASMVVSGVSALLVASACLRSGVAGGYFGPTMYAGAAFGSQLAAAIAAAPTLGALAGVAAMPAGVLRVPLAGSVFAAELAAAPEALPVLLLASFTAFLLARRVDPAGIGT